MRLADELGKRRQLMVVKKVDFGVYLGTNDDKVLLPEKQVPKDIAVSYRHLWPFMRRRRSVYLQIYTLLGRTVLWRRKR